jgi:RHS repeat-associated protein
MRSSRVVLSTLLLAFCGIFAPACLAQLPPVSSTTSTPIPGAGHDYLGGPAETVNPVNGSVSIRLPVIMPPSRGITLPFSFAYDSNGVNYLSLPPGSSGTIAHWKTSSTGISQGGWSDSVPTISERLLSWTTTNQAAPQGSSPLITTIHCYAMVDFVLQDARGNRHNLDLTNYSDPGGTGPCTINSQDWPVGFDGAIITQGGEGSIAASIPTGWTSYPPVTVTDGDGTTYSFSWRAGSTSLPTSVTDRNGNYLTVSSTLPAFSYIDTTGRSVLQDSGFAASPETVTVSGLGAPYTLTWTTLATPSFTTPITVISGSCSTDHPGWQNTQNHAVSTLTLPNGKSYSFAYDSVYGLVNKITYPTGGYVRYVWGMNAQAELASSQNCTMHYGVPAITDRYVSFDGTNEVQHQHFSYTTTWGSGAWTSKQTTVTTYDLVRNMNFQTIYTYSSLSADIPPNSVNITTQIPVESGVAYYNDLGTTLLKTVSKSWQNVRLLSSQQTAFPNGQTSKTTWTYNGNEMETEHDDYDFGNPPPGPFLRATVTSYATSTAMAAAHVIDKPASVIVYSDSAKTNKVAETDYTYDNPVGTTTSGIVQHTTSCNCGNLTSQSQWLNSSGTTLTTTYTNDDTGQRLTMTDPRNNQTTYSYTDSYSSGTPPGPTNAYLTTVTHPQTSGINHVEKFAYAYASGEVTSSTDQNNLVTSYKYVDNLARLTETDFPDGGVTTIAYNDAAYNPSTPSPSVTTTKKINTSTNLVTVSAMDGLGHVLRSELTSDPQGTVYRDTVYDGLGRVYTVSNPYRSGTDPTTSSGTTTYAYDAIGRKLTETYPDSSVLTTAYCAGSTLVTDPTGKWRRSRVDGLGRLVEVDEPNAPGATVASTGCPGTGEPIWVTSYTLDTLGNLKTVLQNGSHQRNFTYDWASRLLTSNNPEVGTITYNYDSDSNCASPNSFAGLLVSKVDARTIRTCAQYDALNRATVLNYSNGDPTITTSYDQSACLGLSACQNIGQRTSQTDAAGTEAWSYQVDATNHRSVHVNQRTTSTITKTSTYYLDMAGNVTQAVYPTGRVVNYTFNAANRPITAADGSNGITYATDFQTPPTGCLTSAVCYTPQGSFYALSIGQTSSFTGLNLTHSYNSRLQPNEFKASSTGGNAIDITYGFVDPSTSKNAGHVYSITNNLDTTRSQNFTYDQLNRISSALTTSTHATSPSHCWGETYTLDAWANLNSIAATTNSNYTGCTQESGFSTTADGNNHLPTLTYDPSGNTLTDGAYTYTWDAESQLKSAGGVTYTYDGDGRRVSKVGSKLYWYGSGGDILAETNASGTTTAEYIFFGGKRIAMLPAGSTSIYYVEDLLGTSRVTTTNTGVVCYDADFYPYGGERSYTNTCPQNYKFEGKERDAETGNDDFGARYYSNRFGRWLSSDWSSVPVPIPYANLTNPQTLNLYSMVADDPESFADLDGHTQQQSQGGAEGQCGGGTGNTSGDSCAKQPDQDAQKAQNQNPDPVQQVTQAMADAKQKAIAEQNRPPTEQDKANALVQAGQMGDAGVKAAMVVTAPNYIAMGVIVATDAGAVEVGKNVVQGVKNVNEELVRPAGQRVGAEIEARVPGGVKAATDFARGALSPRNAPKTPAGVAGAVTRLVVDKFVKTLFQ